MIELAKEFPRTTFASEEMAVEMLAAYHTVHDLRSFAIYDDEVTYQDGYRLENRPRVAHYARIAHRRLQAGDTIDTLLQLGGAYDASDTRERIPTEDDILARKAACIVYGCSFFIELFAIILEKLHGAATAHGQDTTKVPVTIRLGAIPPHMGPPFELQHCEDARMFQDTKLREGVALFMRAQGGTAVQNYRDGQAKP
ncbi:hypothetical protein [Alloyangia pacifica]|uniref:Uncharacterized protein n=1 Tax=Alloyangia pacifica TaxID=311180 RepID=A0A1I6PRB9_9RHOB|nr:hypothetical protein [Alloyangia pacifica]SDG33739.1 hypothetical protein SAMN04488245_102414 [Alloyangia pacifica]SFS42734.1 hypothetical protein SAMN04488050_101715 [Alloyangia pacifica]